MLDVEAYSKLAIQVQSKRRCSGVESMWHYQWVMVLPKLRNWLWYCLYSVIILAFLVSPVLHYFLVQVKNCIEQFERVLQNDRVRYFGNTPVGDSNGVPVCC